MSVFSPQYPDKFDAFWQETVDLAEHYALDFSVGNFVSDRSETHAVAEYEFKSISGQKLFGWVAKPKAAEGESPGFLWLPPYSRWSMLPNEYGTRIGYSSISLNYFGESAFHQEVYKPERGYFADGAESPETWIFRRMIQDAILVSRIFAEQDFVDRNRIGAMGMSQGGGMSIWLGAVCPRIKAVVADMPFLGAMPWVLDLSKAFRYPLKELTDAMLVSEEHRQAIFDTLSYFDTVNLAGQCLKPTRVTLGLKDPAVKPDQARAVYAALPGQKEIQEIDWGHDWHPEMISGGLNWFNQYI